MVPTSARLQKGFVYNHISCPENFGRNNLNIFPCIISDIKQEERARYPSLSTSLSIVYGNDHKAFSVKCFTRRSPDFAKGGKYESLKECEFLVTGKYDSEGKASATINKCQLHHCCQEEFYMEARDKLETPRRGERQRNTKRSFIELNVDKESKKQIVREVSLSINIYFESF